MITRAFSIVVTIFLVHSAHALAPIEAKVLYSKGVWTINEKKVKKTHLPIEIVTHAGASVQVVIDDLRVEVHAESHLTLREGANQELELELSTGEFILANPDAQKLKIQTPISDSTTTVLAASLRYERPELSVAVGLGQFTLSGIGSEESTEILAGEKAFLRAKVENDQIVFDELLAGTKVVRAELSQTQKLTLKELAATKLNPLPKSKTSGQAQMPIPPSAAMICKKPLGKLNDCRWMCQKSLLTRTRCNASGEWSDALVVARDCANKTPVRVDTCDY